MYAADAEDDDAQLADDEHGLDDRHVDYGVYGTQNDGVGEAAVAHARADLGPLDEPESAYSVQKAEARYVAIPYTHVHYAEIAREECVDPLEVYDHPSDAAAVAAVRMAEFVPVPGAQLQMNVETCGVGPSTLPAHADLPRCDADGALDSDDAARTECANDETGAEAAVGIVAIAAADTRHEGEYELLEA